MQSNEISMQTQSVARYIETRRAALMKRIGELTAKRREIWAQVETMREKMSKISAEEAEQAKELKLLNQLAEVVGGQTEASTVCAPPAASLPAAAPVADEQPAPDVCIPERGEVVYSLPAREASTEASAPNRKKKVQLCGATITKYGMRENLSYKQLSTLTGIGMPELHEIVDNNAPTNPYKAQRLALALSCTVGDLMAQPSAASASASYPQGGRYSRIEV